MRRTYMMGLRAHWRFILIVVSLFYGRPLVVHAQFLPVGDPLEGYLLMLRGAGQSGAFSASVRPLPLDLVNEVDSGAVHPWHHLLDRYRQPHGMTSRFGVFDALGEAYWNSARPYGQNDGAVWQGKGGTVAFSVGVFARYGVVSGVLRPSFIHTANAGFELSALPVASGRSPYAYSLRPDIDTPQRFGTDPYSTVDLGQSYLRIDYKGLVAGISNENLWWGPALRNPIIMSNHAPGFVHAFLGTSGPVDVYVGRLQGRWIWGSLDESAYFDSTAGNDHRFLSAIVLDYTPRWIPGLSVGMSHALMLDPRLDKQFFRDYLGVINLPLVENSRPVGLDDKVVSLFGNWVFPESGFEVYVEWARGDHSRDFRDLLVTPDHGRGYTAGVQKVFEASSRAWWRLQVEHTMLEAPREAGGRDKVARGGSYFYTHEEIKQGYTQRGQVIGAGIGPGANSQFVGLDLFASWGKVGVFGSRLARDNDRYYSYLQGALQWWRYEVELATGMEFLLFLGDIEVGGGVTYARLLNKDYVFKNDETNINLTFSLRWALMGFR